MALGMKTLNILMVAGAIWLGAGLALRAQTMETGTADTAVSGGGLTKPLSDRPFLGTPSVLTLGGDYVNTPMEDYQMFGVWSSPLTLDEMHGAIAEVGFGKADKQGQWRLAYKRKLMTMDPSWQAIADSNRSMTLSDSRTEVLKASYSLKDWWQLGVSGFSENKFGATDPNAVPFGLDGGQSLGFQIDSSLKF